MAEMNDLGPPPPPPPDVSFDGDFYGGRGGRGGRGVGGRGMRGRGRGARGRGRGDFGRGGDFRGGGRGGGGDFGGRGPLPVDEVSGRAMRGEDFRSDRGGPGDVYYGNQGDFRDGPGGPPPGNFAPRIPSDRFEPGMPPRRPSPQPWQQQPQPPGPPPQPSPRSADPPRWGAAPLQMPAGGPPRASPMSTPRDPTTPRDVVVVASNKAESPPIQVVEPASPPPTPPPEPSEPSGSIMALTRLIDMEAQLEYAFAKHVQLLTAQKRLRMQYNVLEGLGVGVDAIQDELDKLQEANNLYEDDGSV